MSIAHCRFPNSFLVLPNTTYFFESTQTISNLFRIIRTFDCADVATICLTPLGTFGFIFADSSDLASITALRFCGQGEVPQKVIESENRIKKLQARRVLFINFVSAVFFGRITAKECRSLSGALYNGQDRIFEFDIIQNTVSTQCTEKIGRIIEEKVSTLNTKRFRSNFLNESTIDDAISYVQHALIRQKDFKCANFQSCMVMNYQAAILHNQQHFDASLALNFVVIESLVREIFMAYGLITSSTVQSFATKQHNVLQISKTEFGKMNICKAIEKLYKGSLLSDDLHQRLNSIRKKRNTLLHEGKMISPGDSGECQTVVRDLWAFFLDDPFELITSWSYVG